jgi:hypothetical protein
VDQFISPTSQIIGLIVEALKQYAPETFTSSVHLSHIFFYTPPHFDEACYEVNTEITPSEKGVQFSVCVRKAKAEKRWSLYGSGSASAATGDTIAEDNTVSSYAPLACESSYILIRKEKKIEGDGEFLCILFNMTCPYTYRL